MNKRYLIGGIIIAIFLVIAIFSFDNSKKDPVILNLHFTNYSQ